MSNPFNLDDRAVQRMLADVHGARAAAWLLRPRRRSLRVLGCVEFVLPFGNRVPRWFKFAMACLRMRPRWRVKSFTSTAGNMWRVYWLGGSRARALAS